MTKQRRKFSYTSRDRQATRLTLSKKANSFIVPNFPISAIELSLPLPGSRRGFFFGIKFIPTVGEDTIGGGAGRLSGALAGGATEDPVKLLLTSTGGLDVSVTGIGFFVCPVKDGSSTGTKPTPRVTLVASGRTWPNS